MKLRIFLAGLLVTYLTICALWGPAITPKAAAGPGRGELFDPVFDIMNRLPEDKGCYGCHVGPKPAIGFWFGEDRDSVLTTLQTGINPNGDDLGIIPLEGGRKSDFGRYLRNGIMPLGGTPWEEKELAIMDAWLITYEPPPQPFDPVFEIMNRPRTEKGCVGCHVGPKPAIGFWFGADRDSVLATLETGINPNGDDLGFIPLEGGRKSEFGRYLRNGIMPLGGTPWEEADLAIMDAWLITYEPPPHPFDAVFDIMNRPRGEKGCVGCHIGPRPAIGFWFGADRDAVLATLETGINPNGEDYGFPFVEGGRLSVLGAALHQGRMPRGGTPWTKKDLTLLDDWLLIYE